MAVLIFTNFTQITADQNGFEEYVREKSGGVVPVARIMVSLFQYLLIRYRRFNEYSVVIPALKVFITLKGWLVERDFENDWKRIFHNFVGYFVDMMPRIAENEECQMANAYLTTIYRLTQEAREAFTEKYFVELEELARGILRDFREKCGITGEIENRKGSC